MALARRESPHRGFRLLGLARLLVADLPGTLEAMATGVVLEWRATLVAQAAVVLDPADRRLLDAELAPGCPACPTGTSPRRRAPSPTGPTPTRP